MATEPQVSTKESIIGRSPKGNAVISFDTIEAAKKYLNEMGMHRITLFKQTITEELIKL